MWHVITIMASHHWSMTNGHHWCLWHVITVCDRSSLSVTSHHCQWHVITVGDMSFLSVTCQHCQWHVSTVSDKSSLSVICHHCQWHFFTVSDMSLLSVISHHCLWHVITVGGLSLLDKYELRFHRSELKKKIATSAMVLSVDVVDGATWSCSPSAIRHWSLIGHILFLPFSSTFFHLSFRYRERARGDRPRVLVFRCVLASL